MGMENMEDMGLDLQEQMKKKITIVGEAGYRPAWGEGSAKDQYEKPLSPDLIRDAAINRADLEELNNALDRMEKTIEANPQDEATRDALHRVKARIDDILKSTQH